MTNFESFAIAVSVIIVAIGGVWCLYTLIKLPENVIDAPDEAPCKIEQQDHPFDDLEIKSAFKKAIKKKRKYTKRSKYWGSPRHKAKLRKARSAKKAKSKQEA